MITCARRPFVLSFPTAIRPNAEILLTSEEAQRLLDDPATFVEKVRPNHVRIRRHGLKSVLRPAVPGGGPSFEGR